MRFERGARLTHRHRAYLATLAALGAGGCTIIVQSGGSPTPVPVSAPLSCVSTGDAPSAHVFVDLRVERGTVNLAGAYEHFLRTTVAGLAAAGIMTSEAVMVRLDERPIETPMLAAWGCNLDSPDQLTPTAVIEHWATAATPAASPVGCATDPLVNVGAHLAELVTQYPPELPGTSGRRVFGRAPSIALVIDLDGQGRRTSFDEAGCAGARALLDPAWLAYADGRVPMDHVVHWFVSTDERIDRDTFVARCRAYEGFPSEALDLIDPSPKALYGPLASALDGAGAGHVAALPLCAMLVDSKMTAFLKDELENLADVAGTKLDAALLDQVLSGELPSPSSMTPGG